MLAPLDPLRFVRGNLLFRLFDRQLARSLCLVFQLPSGVIDGLKDVAGDVNAMCLHEALSMVQRILPFFLWHRDLTSVWIKYRDIPIECKGIWMKCPVIGNASVGKHPFSSRSNARFKTRAEIPIEIVDETRQGGI